MLRILLALGIAAACAAGASAQIWMMSPANQSSVHGNHAPPTPSLLLINTGSALLINTGSQFLIHN